MLSYSTCLEFITVPTVRVAPEKTPVIVSAENVPERGSTTK